MPLALEFADVDTGAEYFRHFFNQVFFAARMVYLTTVQRSF